MPVSTLIAAGVLLAVLGSGGAVISMQERPQREGADSGAYLYRTFCASCHGDTGRGDGPVADLAVRRPANLTTLALRHGGVYPRAAVRATLDGTSAVEGHAGPGTPDWAESLRRSARGDERAVQQQIDAIVAHVETLQVKPERSDHQ